MAADKKLTIRIDADDRATEKIRQVQKAINENTSQNRKELGEAVSAVTGGLLGAGLMASLMAAIGVARELIEKAGRLIIDSRRLGVTPAGLQRARDLAAAAGDPNLANQSIQAARQARADAVAGEPNAVKAFRDLGLSVEELVRKNPLSLRDAVLEAFRQSGQGQDQREALRDILGNEAGSAFEGLAAGGFFRREGFFMDGLKRLSASIASNPLLTGLLESGGGMGIFGQLTGAYANLLAGGLISVSSRRFEPLSQFGDGDEQRVGMMREINAQRAAEISRAQLTIEERLNAALQERSRLVQLIERTVNPIARERLVSRALGVEAEILDLQQKRATDQTMAKMGILSTSGPSRPTDSLRSLGFDLGRLSSAGPNYPQQLVQQGERHQRTLDEIRTELRKFNE